jgi:hypothetical protein
MESVTLVEVVEAAPLFIEIEPVGAVASVVPPPVEMV